MSDEDEVRVTVLASAQLLPTIQFLLHAAHHYGARLRFVGIYHTPDKQNSKDPAERLARMLQKWRAARGAGFEIECHEGDMVPDKVRQGLRGWFHRAPNARWLVNVTGGTKPMFGAAAEVALTSGLRSVRVLYLEIAAGWCEIFLEPGTGLQGLRWLDPTLDSEIPPANAIDRLLPLDDLTQTQFPAEVIVTSLDIGTCALEDATRRAISNGWHWQRAMKEANPGAMPFDGDGNAFERFVGAGLLGAGLPVLRQSMKVSSAASNTLLAETDLVTVWNGRLVCIDLKLPIAEKQAKGVQLGKAASDSRNLGGQAAQVIVLRPAWTPDEVDQLKDLRKALRVTVLTQAHAATLFTHLLAEIDPNLRPSPEALAVERLLLDHQQLGNDVLSTARNNTASDGHVVSLDGVALKTTAYQQRPWLLIRLDEQTLRLQVLKQSALWPGGQAPTDLRQRLLRLLATSKPKTSHVPVRDDKWLAFDLRVVKDFKAEGFGKLVDRACRGS